jgi:gluconokinase
LGAALAEPGLPLGGDDFTARQPRQDNQGIALTDAVRDGWLNILGQRTPSGGMVLTYSALKRRYRDRLRQPGPAALSFWTSTVTRAGPRGARSATHFFSTSLVDSQFATLESPVGEPGVWRADARLPLAQLQGEASAWLNKEAFA